MIRAEVLIYKGHMVTQGLGFSGKRLGLQGLEDEALGFRDSTKAAQVGFGV